MSYGTRILKKKRGLLTQKVFPPHSLETVEGNGHHYLVCADFEQHVRAKQSSLHSIKHMQKSSC